MENICPACPQVIKGLKKYVTDIKYFFSKDFKTENYYKHFFYSLVLSFGMVLLFLKFFHLSETAIWFQLFIGGFGAYFVNWVREEILREKFDAIFSWTDVNMGSYGGIVGAALSILTFKYI